jgi:pyocin large subunit-like protein
MTGLWKLLLTAFAGAILVYVGLHQDGNAAKEKQQNRPRASNLATGTPETWGNPASLRDHFERHGRDFAAKNPDDYARMAAEFFRRAKADGLPAKVDNAGTIRVFDPGSGAFGAYNTDGTTKTFFKPGSDGYFDRQPGRRVDLRTWR